MKKIFIICLLAIINLAAFAQSEPNRILVVEGNSFKGFALDRVDSIIFRTIDEEVLAEISFEKFAYGQNDDTDTIWLSVTRTPECKTFRIACVPKTIGDVITDVRVAIAYFERNNEALYSQDFTSATMTGFPTKFNSDTEYTLVTLGYDQYGVASGMHKVDFRTPKVAVQGRPHVDYEIVSKDANSFTLKFIPNEDTKAYAICAFLKGQAEKDFQQWAPMFGFSSMGDMVKKFGQKEYTAEHTNTWKRMDPNTEYELYIQAWDYNDTYADMIIAPVKTDNQGGTGVAQVTIEVLEASNAEGQMVQHIVYTPNAECSLHRDMIIEKAAYNEPNWGEEGILNYLKQDREFPDWNQYGVDNAYWNVNPSTQYIAFSIAKNINDEWGPLAKVEFSTPASANMPRKGKKSLNATSETTYGPTTVPANLLKSKNTGITLQNK